MYYSIRHVTRFRYSAPIKESMVEVRMHPRTEANQRCLKFNLTVAPRRRLLAYRDFLGNAVYHFDVPGEHSQLTITAESSVETTPAPQLPESFGPDAWEELDRLLATEDYLDWTMPSTFARRTGLLSELADELKCHRRDDPISLIRELNKSLYEKFEYAPNSTKVDSPIDAALALRKGVCQDFAHIMTALLRDLRVPCRYVSGYLFHRVEDHDRSADGATHAWVEALLPQLGWVGFDPTNNLVIGDRHIRVAIGRDYADVPPTRGVFKGEATSELDVAVKVSPSDAPPPEEVLLPSVAWSPADYDQEPQQQQQQQQQ